MWQGRPSGGLCFGTAPCSKSFHDRDTNRGDKDAKCNSFPEFDALFAEEYVSAGPPGEDLTSSDLQLVPVKGKPPRMTSKRTQDNERFQEERQHNYKAHTVRPQKCRKTRTRDLTCDTSDVAKPVVSSSTVKSDFSESVECQPPLDMQVDNNYMCDLPNDSSESNVNTDFFPESDDMFIDCTDLSVTLNEHSDTAGTSSKRLNPLDLHPLVSGINRPRGTSKLSTEVENFSEKRRRIDDVVIKSDHVSITSVLDATSTCVGPFFDLTHKSNNVAKPVASCSSVRSDTCVGPFSDLTHKSNAYLTILLSRMLLVT